MAVHARHTFLLLLGFIFVISKKYSEIVAHPIKLNSELEGQPQLEPEQDAIRIRKIDHEASTATKADIPPTENKENNFPVLQRRGIIIGNGFLSHSQSGSSRVNIGMGSLTIRAQNLKNQLNVSINNNKVFLGNKVLCDNINKQLDKATYQKTSDGTQWYTNIKIGEPMSQAEIEDFKADWAKYEKEQEERRKQREAERKQRQKEREKERKIYRQQKEAERRQREEERERQRKEREEERERYRQEREAERRQREEEKERQRIEREEERQQREAEKRQREEEREREREESEEERERERREGDEEDSKPKKNKKGAKSTPRRAKPVTSTREGKRPKKVVNMHNPFRSDFMEGFMDGFMVD